MYLIKLKWKPLNESLHSAQGPHLHNLLLDTWIKFNTTASTTANTAVIPGWEENNDLDNDAIILI